jgi:hypothetical protein
MDTFSALLRGCISEVKEGRRAREALEGAALLVLGVGCSVLTSYLLAALRLVV